MQKNTKSVTLDLMLSTASTKALDKPFSEVISYTSEMIIAQCYKESISDTTLNKSIIQGSTIKVISSYDSSYAAFGIIAKINNSSLDNIHKPSALGLTPKELAHLQPQVYDLLRKELEICLFAYQEKGQIYKHLPLKPFMIHDFVYLTNQEEVLQLTENFSTLINVIKKNHLNLELLLAPVIEGYKLRDYNYQYLLKVGRELTHAFSDEVETLIPTLKRLSEEQKKTN